MKKVIVNNDKIRVTANGQSIVEGSFARVTEIRGKSVKCKNLLETLSADEINQTDNVGEYATVTRTSSGAFNIFIRKNPNLSSGYAFIVFTNNFGLEKGVTYYLSGSPKHYENGNALIYIHLFGEYTDGTTFSFNDYGDGNEVKIEKDIKEMFCYFTFNFGNDTQNFLVNRTFTFFPMLNEGNKPLPYQPYFDGFIHSKIKGIYSNNRNLLSTEQSNLISDKYAGLAVFDKDLIELINSKKINYLTASSNYTSNRINWNILNDPKITINLLDRVGEGNASYSYYKTYNGITQKRKVTHNINKNYKISDGLVWFNDFSGEPIGVREENSFISVQNQLEIGENPTRYVESKNYQYDLPSEITLRSSIDNESIYDVYYPEQGLIIRCINEDGTIKSTPIFEDITPIAYNGYKAFNNGFEKLISNIDSNGFTPYDYGAIPEIVVEYEVEPKQGADRTRFDFITLDGEAICGIGYEKLKSTNQLQYVEEPDRQNDGSMSNIEDYDTFVLPALEVGFNCINEETYRRLKHKLISKRTFDVGYYDKDLDKVVTMEMYVKPIDLDNFLSYGDDIIGMNFSISFVPTLNEETLFSVTFLKSDYNTIIKEYSGNNGVLYGRAIETPALPSDCNYWLMIESGFKENTFVKIKGNKKLSIFGNTKLIAVK